MKFKVRLRWASLISFFILLMLCLNLTNLISSEQAGSTSFPASFSHPIIFSSSVSPTKVQPGDLMLVSAVVFDFFGVERVEAKFFHEQGFDIVNLSRVIGSNHLGVWQGQWMVHDTKIKEYTTQVTAFSSSGLSSFKDLTWDDPVSWWDMDWSYRKLITLSSSQVSNDLTNFPVLINITDTDLKNRSQPDADDIAFTDSSGNQLNHEIESYTSGTGKLIAWVNVTTLSSSSDTEIYMYYGNSGCASQQNSEGTWDSHYLWVFHMSDDDSDTVVVDSTGNHNNGTKQSANEPTQDTGRIHKAQHFDDSGNTYDTITVNTGSSITAPYTVESLAYYDDLVQDDYDYILSVRETDSNLAGSMSRFPNSGGDANKFYCYDGAGANVGPLITGQEWNCYALVFHTTASDYADLFIDGEEVTLDDLDKQENCNGEVVFGRWTSGTWGLDGLVDESRMSDIQRNDSWINTTYYTQINGYNGGFYSVGSEEVAIPTKPTLTAPANNDCINNPLPRFEWTVSENAENHRIRVDNETNLMDDDERINVSLSSIATSYDTLPVNNLSEEGRWYWNVSANNSNGENASELYSFIVDITGPDAPSLSSPAENENTSSNSVTFTWYAANDSTVNTTEVSNIDYYQLQVDNNSDFSSPLINNENTADNSTLSLTKTVTGQLYWRVRAVDQAGNAGNYSTSRNLTVFSFLLTSSASSFNILKGNSKTVTISIAPDFGVAENITLSTEWQETPSDVSTSFNTTTSNSSSWSSTLTITVGGDAPTEDYICFVNGTSASGVTKSVQIAIDINSMVIDLSDPVSFSLIRDDSATTTLSVKFLIGGKETVTLSGGWYGTSPSGVTATISPSSGTPSFDSTLTISTSKTASAGTYTYRVTGSGGGMTCTVDEIVVIRKNLTLTISTDDSTYEKGQEIQISGTAKDPDGNSVGSGTATIQLSATSWSHSFTTSITSGVYSTSYYIAFDKPGGDWTVSVTATDSHGHETSSSVSTSISVGTPEIYEHYYIDVLSPTAGQVFKRGETVTFSISLYDSDDEKIQGADVKACFSSGEEVVFSEGSAGMYSVSYDLGYDFPVGSLSVYVEGKNLEDGKLKVGFNYIDFRVKSISPVLELIEPKAGALIEVGETIKIRIKALYPDGTPLEESVIIAVGPDGEELLFIRSKEPGIYVASYTLSADDFGDWAIQIKLEDAYGNSVVLEGVNVEIVHSRVMSILLRYWWATLVGVIAIAALVSYLVHRKLRKIKLFNLKNEILELGKLKKRNAILYFSEGEITRETYDKLSQDYESKIARLSKKQRLLEKKIEKKKNIKKEGGGK